MRLVFLAVAASLLAGCACQGTDPTVRDEEETQERGQGTPGHVGKPGEMKLQSGTRSTSIQSPFTIQP
ncbi:MAG: hypothetical protein WDO68_24460 [Gammaproteobacteria bacterium]